MKTTFTHFKIHIRLIALLGGLLFSLNLLAQDPPPCKTPWIPPFFDVAETHWDVPQSFWQNGGHIPENVVDEDTTNYARAHIKATGSATLNVHDNDETNVYPSGFFVGYYVKCRAFRDTIFDGVTVTTYLNGVMQESYSGVHLYVDHIPTYVNEPICIGFFTTLPWNEIEIEFNSSVRVHYDVFYAVLGACIEELPPGLPITWLSFEVQKKGEASDLKWVTAQEFNNTGFHVERSADGRYFESIGTVDASYDHSGINQYSYMDLNPIRGMNHYRIRQVDTDGRSSYSDIQSIDFSYDKPDITSWPNPARESLNVMLPLDLPEGEIKLINSSGMLVLSKPYVNSVNEYSFDISQIDQGFYTLLIETPGQVYIKKIVVLK